MSFLRKLSKNKFVVLAVCVIVVCLVYTGVRKAIDNYAFNKNADVVSEEERLNGNNEEKNLEGSDGEGTGEDYPKKEGLFEESEIDLELEGDLDGEEANDAGSDGIGVADSKDVGTSNQTGVDEVTDSVGSANGAGGFGSAGSNSGKIYIYITGEVNVPGVVILNEGSRIVDAINAAGGTTDKANVTKVNLVYVLEDGMKVNIPNDNDLKNNPDFEYITLNSGDGRKEDYYVGASSTGSSSSNGSNLSTSSGYGSERKYSSVNINTATQTELETLPGIGPSLALKIINYRKENGKFSSIEEIKNVSGIGESKFESLKRYIMV